MINPLSENAVQIKITDENSDLKEQFHQLQKVTQRIQELPFSGFIELVPAYNTITIYYNPYVIKKPNPFHTVKSHLENILCSLDDKRIQTNRYIEIPVCYDEEFGIDLAELAANKKMSIEEVIQIHSDVVYDVMFIGFAPGFPFLAGLDKRLHSPRKTSPRLKVNQGSVGIAGHQTGIYPLDSPGGWQIIGRTPIKLFDIHQNKPTLLQAGDQIKFFPISKKEFLQWETGIRVL